MKDHFKGTQDGPKSDVKTRAELLARLRQRKPPRAEQHLKPRGATRQPADAAARQENEERIAKIRDRLNNAKQRLESNYAIRHLHGRAKADFGRSR